MYVGIPEKNVRSPFACMDVLQSMLKGTNNFWNFTEYGSVSATYINIFFCYSFKQILYHRSIFIQKKKRAREFF